MNDAFYYVYILRCADDSFYIGATNNLEKRIRAHNGLIKGGAKYTRAKKPVELVYYEKYDTKSEALQKEVELKKLNHKEKEAIILNSTTK